MLEPLISWWDGVVAYFTDPFWLYLAYGIGIALGAAVLAWLFPVLRSLAAAVIFGVAAGLFGYRRGERDQAERELQRRQREETQRQRDRQWNHWWW